MDPRPLFAEHVETVCREAAAALEHAAGEGPGWEGLVLHAGRSRTYHADDQEIPFHTVPHFRRFAPTPGPDHLLCVRPGARPRLVEVFPPDFWYEPPEPPDHPYTEVLDVERVPSAEAAREALGDVSRCAYIGDDASTAAALGVPLDAVEPPRVLAALDWYRGLKTPYEVACIREAGRIAARGHTALGEAAPARRSEWDLHALYLNATDQLELDVPYGNIIAWDAHAAILHYQSKRRTAPQLGASLLVDAGASCYGYASDITRTWVQDDAPAAFRAAAAGMEKLQRRLVEQVGPGVPYVDVHLAAHRGVAEILHEIGVLRVRADEALDRGLTRPFLPHGVGHHLGIQVHDVGGRQIDPDGTQAPPPEGHPYLRTTRPLAPGHVVTIEPGLYFIPMLLDPLREGADRDAIDWKLVDRLLPCGGIRVEDDVWVTEDGRDDLTRPFVGASGA